MAAAERPACKEIIAIVLGCAILLVGLAKLDHAAYEKEMRRARVAIAEQERRAQDRPEEPHVVVETRKVAPRTESLGGRGPIPVPLGGAWSAGTTSSVADVTGPAVPRPELRRIVGPVIRHGGPLVAEPRTSPAAAAPAGPAPDAAPHEVVEAKPEAVPAVSVVNRHELDERTVLAIVLAGVGVLLSGVGVVLLRLGR